MKKSKQRRISKREQKRLDLIERWENTLATDPFYQGKTPLEVVRALLKPKNP